MSNRSLPSLFFFALLAAAMLIFSCKPAVADEKQGFGLDGVVTDVFFSHFQTGNGSNVDFPEVGIRVGFRTGVPRLRLSFNHFHGESPTVNGFQADVNDNEGRVNYRLDDPNDKVGGDSLARNVYGWLSWKIWTSDQLFPNGTIDHERD